MIALPHLNEADLAEVCREFRVKCLELFGSASRDPESANDFDFLVDFEDSDPGRFAAAFFGLQEALQRITGKSVHLITPSALTNPYFRASVESSKLLLYAA